MLIVTGTVVMDPGDVRAIEAAAVIMMEETRKEAGCITYEFSEVIGQPGVMRIYEEWESGPHLEAHFEAPHMGPWRDAMKSASVRSRSLHRYDDIGAISAL